MENTDLKRIVTNSDLDALVSAVLLKRVHSVGAVKFLPLEDVREDRFSVRPVDIVVNMPYLKGCCRWFDHHASNEAPAEFPGRYNPEAPSAARVIYNFYSSRGKSEKFSGLEELLRETDRVDDADFRREDILEPGGAVLLSFIIDSAPLKEHTASENQLLINLLDSGDPEVAIEHPVIQPRVRKFRREFEISKELIAENLERQEGLLVLDYRNLSPRERRLCGNKFIPFVLEPDAHTLLRIKNLNQKKVKLGLGFNMFLSAERLPRHYGKLLANYDGGGHARAAGCAVVKTELGPVLEEIKKALSD